MDTWIDDTHIHEEMIHGAMIHGYMARWYIELWYMDTWKKIGLWADPIKTPKIIQYHTMYSSCYFWKILVTSRLQNFSLSIMVWLQHGHGVVKLIWYYGADFS